MTSLLSHNTSLKKAIGLLQKKGGGHAIQQVLTLYPFATATLVYVGTVHP